MLICLNGTPLQYSCLENPMDGGAWKAAVHGVAEGWTQLSDFPFTFHFHALEKEMASHSSVLAWRIPGTGEPGGLRSMGSHRVRHDWSDWVVWLYIFFFSLIYLLIFILCIFVVWCLMVNDVYLLCELYLISLKMLIFVSFKNKWKKNLT